MNILRWIERRRTELRQTTTIPTSGLITGSSRDQGDSQHFGSPRPGTSKDQKCNQPEKCHGNQEAAEA